MANMVVIKTTDVPDHVRGALTRWLIEPAPGLYVGTVSTRVREELWKTVAASVGPGMAVCIHPTTTSSATPSAPQENAAAASSTPTASNSSASPPKICQAPHKTPGREASAPRTRG